MEKFNRSKKQWDALMEYSEKLNKVNILVAEMLDKLNREVEKSKKKI